MHRRCKTLIVAAAGVAISLPAFAQAGAANNPMPDSASPGATTMSTPATTPAPTGDPSLDEVVCKSEPAPTGTRIGGSRVCKTNREWLQDEDALNRARNMDQQTQNVMPGPGTGHSMGGAGH